MKRHLFCYAAAACAAARVFTCRGGETIACADSVRAEAPGLMFLDQEPVSFAVARTDAGLRYTVTDALRGTVVAAGAVADGRITIPRLGKGCYDLRLAADDVVFTGSRPFGVVGDPAKRRIDRETPFCLDATTGLMRPVPGRSTYAVYGEMLRRAGAFFVHDRFACMKSETDVHWGHAGTLDPLRQQGIHFAVAWQGVPPNERTKGKNSPADLLAVYRYARKLAERFGDRADIWEFWNEPDLVGAWNDSAWSCAAAQKAAYLGWTDGAPGAVVTSPSFCVHPGAGCAFTRMFLANETAPYFNMFNYHIYEPFTEYAGCVDSFRDALATVGVTNLAFIVTENGIRAEGMGKVALTNGLSAHSPDQELMVAEFVPKSQILLRQLGCSRDFFFTMAPYNENSGAKDWGLVRRDNTAKPGLFAFATLTECLAGTRLLGGTHLADGVRAYVFVDQATGRQTLAAWSVSELDTVTDKTKVLKLSSRCERRVRVAAADPLTVTDIFGGVTTHTPVDGFVDLTLTRWPCYIVGAAPAAVTKPARAPGTVKALATDCDTRLVPHLGEVPGAWTPGTRDCLIFEKPPARLAFPVRVCNFGDTPKEVSLCMEGMDAPELPAPFVVPPCGVATAVVSCAGTGGKLSVREVTIRAVSGGRQSTALRFNYMALPDSQLMEPLAGADDPARWQKNSSAESETITWDPEEQAVRVELTFKPNSNRWSYPVYVFSTPLPSDAFGLSFEIKTLLPPKQNPTSLVMFEGTNVQGQKVSYRFPYNQSHNGEWQRNFAPFSVIAPELTSLVRIGVNPHTDRFVYWIRDVRIARAEKGGTP